MSRSRMLDAKDYELAEKLSGSNRSKLVAGGSAKPQWIDKGARFWYRAEGPRGHSFVLVDPAKGTRRPAFDHDRLAKSLRSAGGAGVNAAALPIGGLKFSENAAEFDALNARWRCSLSSYACEKIENHAPVNPLEVKSPDGKWCAFRRGHDLWLRSLETGSERPLTSDGSPDFSYASPPDCLSFGQLMHKFGLPHLPPLVSWSPDSRRVITHRLDQRDIRLSHLVEAAPPGGGPPALHTYRYAFPGDHILPRAHFVVFDVVSGETVLAKGEPVPMPETSPLMFGQLWWSVDGSAVYYLEQPRDLKTLWLKRLDPLTGDVRTLVEEKGEPRVEASQFSGSKPCVRVLSDSSEVLWWSQRDGWGHLYLYDINSGRPCVQVTSGEWVVQQILHVDEDRRVVFFVASGLVESDVYRHQVCRVGLDGKNFARLTSDDLDHIVTVPPNGAYYVDSASTTDKPPVIGVCGWNSSVVVELERADISDLLKTGWTAPERFRVKAADGETDIYGVLYRPRNFNRRKRYPVIDHAYPGPQTNRVQPSFGETKPLYDPESLAALGFVVVAVDGRGTPGRSKAFHDLSYRHLDKAGFLEDHVAAFHQLAKTRPWMDLDRVGIFGSSGGGFATVRAMCAYPEFYKVGVALCGNHDDRFYQLAWSETYLGSPVDNSEAYLKASNVEIADQLKGKLLLIHGEMDDNVHPHLTMRLVDRLIAANKDFDLLIVPGAEHLFVGYQSYVTRRRWDFLVRHLLGAEPPVGYRLAEPRPKVDAFFG